MLATTGLAFKQIVNSPRAVMWTCFAMIVAGAWGYLYAISPDFVSDSLTADLLRSLCLADDDPWSWRSLTAAFVMWSAMILAMMLPTAAPMISTFEGCKVPAAVTIIGKIRGSAVDARSTAS